MCYVQDSPAARRPKDASADGIADQSGIFEDLLLVVVLVARRPEEDEGMAGVTGEEGIGGGEEESCDEISDIIP